MKKSPFVKYAIVAFAVFLVFICFLKKNNMINLLSATWQLHRQKKQIEWYQEDIQRLDERIGVLTEDRDSLEKYARENFHFAEKGDDVYLIDE